MLHTLVVYWPITTVVGLVIVYGVIWVGGAIFGARKTLGE